MAIFPRAICEAEASRFPLSVAQFDRLPGYQPRISFLPCFHLCPALVRSLWELLIDNSILQD